MLTTMNNPSMRGIHLRRGVAMPPEAETQHTTEFETSTVLEEATDKARQLIIARPGTCALAGLIAGGLAGWLTSKLK